MSKKMIASSVLAEWVGVWTTPEETFLYVMIEELKKAVVDVTMLQVAIDDADDEKTLQGVNVVLIHALRNMNNLYNEVKDQMAALPERSDA